MKISQEIISSRSRKQQIEERHAAKVKAKANDLAAAEALKAELAVLQDEEARCSCSMRNITLHWQDLHHETRNASLQN